MRRILGALFTVVAMTFFGLAGSQPSSADVGDIGWTSVCDYSHSLKDDPIVYPGQPGVSHLHDFYGNTTTNAYSTIASLLAKRFGLVKEQVEVTGLNELVERLTRARARVTKADQ